MLSEEKNYGKRPMSSKYHDGDKVRGLAVRIPNGYCVVAQSLTGKLRTAEPGLKFFYPWEKKFMYYVNDIPMDLKKENYKSSEGFEIYIDAAITYRKTNCEIYHEQRGAVGELRLLISEILRTYISKHTFEQISKWTLKLDAKKDDKGNIRIDDFFGGEITEENIEEIAATGEIVKKIEKFQEQYGILIMNIIIQKAELTEELKKSKEEDELTKARNERMKQTAEAELEATKKKAEGEFALAMKRAEAQRIQGEIEAEILERKVAAIAKQIEGADTVEKLRVIKAYLMGDNANYTVIENSTGDADYAKINAFAEALSRNNTDNGFFKTKGR